MAPTASADAIIERLGLQPHPEGGYYRQTFEDRAGESGRAFSTAIYYLLKAGERSHWHRVDAAEVWHFYAGSPLALGLSEDGVTTTTVTLGPDVLSGEAPQVIVPTGVWQGAECLGDWTLVGCTVAPGFRFAGFEMAPPGWTPG
ncbi:hypothetical protein HDIA_3818 [Hartmannibacter diazotrophicus]|uniref:DUF985 domain-containing protein n=1 Tax=Hartmannibacter diazotrophicus TaxID=1482074 RepID=A0A2C9DB06_9HYPH|nr:cupin domain-containing protein [Hartmannibacter diazotrophicus]SON57359.1 hypothetical protein HDIA_3818 [Hartmannibacter diazotrophicus]